MKQNKVSPKVAMFKNISRGRNLARLAYAQPFFLPCLAIVQVLCEEVLTLLQRRAVSGGNRIRISGKTKVCFTRTERHSATSILHA